MTTVGKETVPDSTTDVVMAAESPVSYGWRGFVRRRVSWVVVLLNLTIFFIAWEVFARQEIINPLYLPAPSAIFAELGEMWATGLLQEHLVYSLRNFAIGLLLSALVGIPLGLLMGASRIVDAIFSPYVWAMASLPRVALIPLLILILGFSDTAKITLIFLSAVFPIIVNCMAGVKTVEPSLLRAGRVFGASRPALYAKVVFPYTLPFIISGLNQGMSRGLVGLVIAEIFGGNDGLGFLLSRAGETFNGPRLYGILLVLVIIALTFVQTLRWIEVKIAPWRNQTA
jgi:ABC-type nitrate/sulfonate/bicarbonate transport system permease component